MTTYIAIGDSDMTETGSGELNLAELSEKAEQLQQNQLTAEQKLKLAIFDQLPFAVWASTKVDCAPLTGEKN